MVSVQSRSSPREELFDFFPSMRVPQFFHRKLTSTSAFQSRDRISGIEQQEDNGWEGVVEGQARFGARARLLQG